MSRHVIEAHHGVLAAPAAWTPAQPTEDGGKTPAAWWDASALPAGTLASWTDLVAGTYTATQTTESAKPTVVEGVLNGLSVVRFDGGDWLQFSELGLLNSTVFAVGNRTAANKKLTTLGAAGANYGPYPAMAWTDGNAYQQTGVNPDGTTIYQYAAYADTTTFRLLTSVLTVPMVLRKNGSPLTLSGIASGPATDGVVWIGRRGIDYATGDLACILVYQSVLSAADLAQVESYLAAKWALY